MPSFKRDDVVRVPFPYTDRAVRQRRPALVVSDGAMGDDGALLWVVMITSAENRRWANDIPLVDNLRGLGLPAPSLVRPTKIATIETRDAEVIGRLNPDQLRAVSAAIDLILGREQQDQG
jgi:mRNA interferase MazF